MKPLFYSCMLVGLTLLGQMAIAAPVAPQTIPQQTIQGTSVSLTPPPGFAASRLFTGFEHAQAGASIMAMELPLPPDAAGSFLSRMSAAETLLTRGMRLLSVKDMSIGNYPGKLLLVSQSAGGTDYLKWIGATTVGDRALLVTAAFPATQAKTLQEPLRMAIATLTWRPGEQIQRLSGLPFTFQEQGDLKLSERLSNTVILARNGSKPPIPASEPLLVLGAASRPPQADDIAQFSRLRLQQLPEVRNLAETSGTAIAVAGRDGFELIATAADNRTATPLTVYQAVIMTDKAYYLVQGMVPTTSATTYLPIFRNVTQSVVPQL